MNDHTITLSVTLKDPCIDGIHWMKRNLADHAVNLVAYSSHISVSTVDHGEEDDTRLSDMELALVNGPETPDQEVKSNDEHVPHLESAYDRVHHALQREGVDVVARYQIVENCHNRGVRFVDSEVLSSLYRRIDENDRDRPFIKKDNVDEVVAVLVTRFNMSPEMAGEAAQQFVNAGILKGT